MRCKYADGDAYPTKHGSQFIPKHKGNGEMKHVRHDGIEYDECPECGFATNAKKCTDGRIEIAIEQSITGSWVLHRGKSQYSIRNPRILELLQPRYELFEVRQEFRISEESFQLLTQREGDNFVHTHDHVFFGRKFKPAVMASIGG